MTAPSVTNGTKAPRVYVCPLCPASPLGEQYQTPKAFNLARHCKTVHGHADPVGAAEAAVRLGVLRRTFHAWNERGIQPPAEYPSVNGARAWEWVPLLRWCGDRGLIIDPAAIAEYRARFTVEPAARRLGGPLPPRAAATAAASAG